MICYRRLNIDQKFFRSGKLSFVKRLDWILKMYRPWFRLQSLLIISLLFLITKDNNGFIWEHWIDLKTNQPRNLIQIPVQALVDISQNGKLWNYRVKVTFRTFPRICSSNQKYGWCCHMHALWMFDFPQPWWWLQYSRRARKTQTLHFSLVCIITSWNMHTGSKPYQIRRHKALLLQGIPLKHNTSMFAI